MRLDPNPVYRKVIIPWYDSEPACFVIIVIMFFVFLFGMAGIWIARETSGYHGYTWVPSLLVAMSIGVIVSTTVRLVKRYAARFEE